eukprot:3931110-Amphidinium_carterae.1
MEELLGMASTLTRGAAGARVQAHHVGAKEMQVKISGFVARVATESGPSPPAHGMMRRAVFPSKMSVARKRCTFTRRQDVVRR